MVNMKHAEKSEILTLTEVSEMLHVHPNTLRNWDASGVLKPLRMGEKKIRRYRRSDVEAFLQRMDNNSQAV